MRARLLRPHSTTKRKNISLVRYATRRFTDRIRATCSSSRSAAMRKLTNVRIAIIRRRIVPACLLAMTPLSGLPACAQEESQAGIDQGNYNIKQSNEFGVRFTSIGGDQQTYDTFVNLLRIGHGL